MTIVLFSSLASAAEKPTITVGSKVFAEGYIISEIIAEVIEQAGEANVVRKFGLGGTGIVYQALANGSIDIYPEYSGTISEEILKSPTLNKSSSLTEIQDELKPLKLIISDSLGFNDTYALAVRAEVAKARDLIKISDLKNNGDIRIGFSHEFLDRSDGYKPLVQAYQLNLKNIQGVEHTLAYEAISKDQIDLTDVYSTDAKIQRFNLVVLKDDRHFFPTYEAVILARQDIATRFPKTWAALSRLEGSMSEKTIQELNAMSEIDKKSFADIAHYFFHQDNVVTEQPSARDMILVYTKQHLFLVSISLLAAMLIGIPLGIFSARFAYIGHLILLASGVVQTIPSLALLCFMIPLFGIGTTPALIALFLYGLLPIVINTYTGLTAINSRLIDSAKALGLSELGRLWRIELPLALPSILAGVKTSAITNIGTATLAALVGAGGYGTPIVTGLAVNNLQAILQGAIPAAAMALIVSWLFDLSIYIFIPRLRRQR